ncbi:MAG: hypothetical protein WB714_23425, partial [Candidatus Sulfotelmatobacter sp.]
KPVLGLVFRWFCSERGKGAVTPNVFVPDARLLVSVPGCGVEALTLPRGSLEETSERDPSPSGVRFTRGIH